MVVSSDFLDCNTLGGSILFKRALANKGVTSTEGHLVVDEDITRCMVNKEGATMELVLDLFFTKGVMPSSRHGTVVLIHRNTVSRFEISIFDLISARIQMNSLRVWGRAGLFAKLTSTAHGLVAASGARMTRFQNRWVRWYTKFVLPGLHQCLDPIIACMAVSPMPELELFLRGRNVLIGFINH